MKLFTPDKSLLMEIQSIAKHPDGLVIKGKIMGTMPMNAVLRPGELRAVFKLLNWRVILRLCGMMIRGRA